MEAKSIADQWLTTSVLDRLREQGERTEAQGERITDLAGRQGAVEGRVTANDVRITAAENAIVEIKTLIKTVGWALGVGIPVASAVLIKVIGG